MVPIVVSIAGVDPSAGAGLLADLETLRTHHARGVGVVTLLTVQSSRGVRRVQVVDAALVRDQLEALFEDLPVVGVKTGALGDAAIVRAVADVLRHRALPLVVDPVARSTSGATLLDEAGVEALVHELLPLAHVFTPNLAEASLLTGGVVRDLASMRDAGVRLREHGARAVWVKGGHLEGAPTDLWVDEDGSVTLESARVDTRHTHGTGCALASALAARLAAGEAPRRAAGVVRAWLERAMRAAPGLGAGAGPLELRSAAPEIDSG